MLDPIPKVINSTPGTITALKSERISMYDNISLVKNESTGETQWRRRYTISSGTIPQYQQKYEQYPRKQFKTFKEFKKFVMSLPYENKQVLPSGSVFNENKSAEKDGKNRKDY